jgi:hypothetical protein
MMEETYEFVLCSVCHGSTFSIEGVDTSGGDDGEGHGVAGEVGRSDHTRKGLADESIGLEVVTVCAEKLV